MKELLLILMVILTALGMSACQTEEQTDPIVELETYDYCLLYVVSRERQSQDTFVYVLREVGTHETTDNITYESDELWSVGELVIAIELDEKGNIYLTDLDATTNMIELYYEAKLDWFEEQYNIDLDDVPNDFILWLIEEHPEVYAYWSERVEGK